MGMLVGQVRPVAHHADVLAALRARGVALAVCSNFSHSQTALAVLEAAGLRWHFDAILVSDAVGWRKPRPEIFRATLGALGAAPAETLHVGDSLSADVAGAAALGMRTAWLTRRVPEPEAALAKHEGPRPDHVVADLAQIAELAPRSGRP
jgi:putative hydrolase of the HAD superfamily